MADTGGKTTPATSCPSSAHLWRWAHAHIDYLSLQYITIDMICVIDVYVNMCVYMYISMYMYVCVYICVCIYVCVYMWVCMSIDTCIYMYCICVMQEASVICVGGFICWPAILGCVCGLSSSGVIVHAVYMHEPAQSCIY